MGTITKEYIDGLITTVQNLYLSDDIPWMIGYSGGKDSTAAVQLVWMAIERLPVWCYIFIVLRICQDFMLVT